MPVGRREGSLVVAVGRLAVCMLLLAVASLAWAAGAHADALVGGADHPEEPLVIAPVEASESSSHFTYYDPRVAVIQRMPSTKTIDSVTIGDIGQAPGCAAAATVGFWLRIRESATGRLGDATTLVALGQPQVLPVLPGKVTWSIPETTLYQGRLYSLEVTSAAPGCQGGYAQTTWGPLSGLESGPGPCDSVTSTYGALYDRVWHQEGVDDWTCTSPSRPGSFDVSMPSGWLLTAGYFRQPQIEVRYPDGSLQTPPCYFGSAPVFWKIDNQGMLNYACVLEDFVDPGQQGGWFRGFDGGELNRVVYLDMHTVGWVGPPTHWGPLPSGTPGSSSRDWEDPQDPELFGQGNPAVPNVSPCVVADPVECATGNLTESVTDVSLAGRGLPLSIVRTYNGLDAATSTTTGLFGHGWSSTFADRLTFDSQGRAVVHQANGSTATFWSDATGGWFTPPRVQATLDAVSDGYDFVLPDGSSEHFDVSGRLLRVRSPAGQVTTVSYDGDGHLSAITDAGGRTLAVQTNSDGTVWRVSTPQGRHVDYAYTAGDLTSVTDLAGKTWSYGYDSRHRITSLTDPNGHQVTNEYDGEDRVVAQHQPGGRDWAWVYDAGTTTITDPRGTVTTEHFSGNRLTSRTRALGTPLASTSTFDYDTDGYLIATHDPHGVNVSQTWTAHGDLASRTDPEGHTTHYEWDGAHHLTAVVAPSGRRTEMSYDDAGRLVQVRRHDAEADQTRTKSYTWDGGLLASSTDELSHTTTFAYDTAGDRTSVTTPAGRQTTFAYDQDGYLTSTISPKGNAPGGTPADYRTAYTTDDLGRVTATTDPLGHTTSTSYDDAGNVVQVTDAANHTTAVSYDANDEPTIVTRADQTTTQTSYDAGGAVVSQTDASGKTTSFTHDALGRLTRRSDPLGRHRDYSYDDLDRLTTSTDQAGRQATYSYDDGGRLTGVHHASGDPGDQSFSYDADGRRTAMSDESGTTSYSYDSLGRLTSRHDGHGKTVTYAYDTADRITTISYPQTAAGNGGDVARGYDADGLLSSVTDPAGHQTSFAYDPDAQLTTTTFPASTSNVDQVSYDRAGQITQITAKQDTGTLASFGYTRDALGRVAASTTSGIPGETDHSYTYNSIGRLTAADSQNYAYTPNGAITALDQITGGAYDDARQLGQMTVDGGKSTYSYDELGQRTAEQPLNGPATTYDYDQAGQLTALHPGRPAPDVAAGWQHTLAVGQDAAASGWGWGAFGQLGDGATTNSSVPISVTGLPDVTEVSAGGAHSLALDSHGNVYSWGINSAGQLGPDAPAGGRSVPNRIPGLTAITQTSAGWAHNLAITDDDHVKAWGWNANGQLGDTTTTDHATPQTVSGLSGVAQVAAGYGFSLARKSDGTVWAWGANANYQLGDATNTERHTPVRVGTLSDITQIAAGANYGAALDATGHVWAWGANVGVVQLPGLSNITQLAGGWDHALALTQDGHVYSWGHNNAGQLGNGTTTDNATPTQIAGLSGITRVAAGVADSFAIHSDGTLSAWGANTAGQLGNQTTTNQTTPVTIAGLTLAIPDATSHYTYNADGLRTAITNDGQTTHDTWDTQTAGLPLLLADDHSQYIYGPGGQPIEQIAADGTISYLHHDQLGSTRLITDPTGQTVGTATYSPYGQTTSHTGVTTPLGYAGQITDTDTGLQYLRARYYQPSTGQFLARDPIEDTTGDPYAYTAGDPINHTDPTGLLFDIPGTPSFEDISNAAAGFGDAASLGLTKTIRKALGVDNVNYCSTAYGWGGRAGITASMAVPIGGELPALGRAAKGAENALSQAGKRRLAKRLGEVPRSSSPVAQGGSARTGRWWEYDDVNGQRKIVVEHPDGTVHVGVPKPQSTHATGGPPKYYDYGNFGHVGE